MTDSSAQQQLWCECEGNVSATPRRVVIQKVLEKLHEEAWFTGTVYVSLVVFIYCSTLSFLLYKADRSCSLCWSLMSCACLDPSSASRRRRQPSSQVLQKGGHLTPTRTPEAVRRPVTKLTVPDVVPVKRIHRIIEAPVKVTVEQPSQG